MGPVGNWGFNYFQRVDKELENLQADLTTPDTPHPFSFLIPEDGRGFKAQKIIESGISYVCVKDFKNNQSYQFEFDLQGLDTLSALYNALKTKGAPLPPNVQKVGFEGNLKSEIGHDIASLVINKPDDYTFLLNLYEAIHYANEENQRKADEAIQRVKQGLPEQPNGEQIFQKLITKIGQKYSTQPDVLKARIANATHRALAEYASVDSLSKDSLETLSQVLNGIVAKNNLTLEKKEAFLTTVGDKSALGVAQTIFQHLKENQAVAILQKELALNDDEIKSLREDITANPSLGKRRLIGLGIPFSSQLREVATQFIKLKEGNLTPQEARQFLDDLSWLENQSLNPGTIKILQKLKREVEPRVFLLKNEVKNPSLQKLVILNWKNEEEAKKILATPEDVLRIFEAGEYLQEYVPAADLEFQSNIKAIWLDHPELARLIIKGYKIFPTTNERVASLYNKSENFKKVFADYYSSDPRFIERLATTPDKKLVDFILTRQTEWGSSFTRLANKSLDEGKDLNHKVYEIVAKLTFPELYGGQSNVLKTQLENTLIDNFISDKGLENLQELSPLYVALYAIMLPNDAKDLRYYHSLLEGDHPESSLLDVILDEGKQSEIVTNYPEIRDSLLEEIERR